MPDRTCVGGNRILHRLFWVFQPCVKGFAFCKPIPQIDATWLYGEYKGTLLMIVTQDDNINIFPVSFTLVEGETLGGWSLFIKNIRAHVAPQPNLYLISDRHASIESAYIILRMNGIILLLAMSTALYISHKISCRRSKIRTFGGKKVNAWYALTQPLFCYTMRKLDSQIQMH